MPPKKRKPPKYDVQVGEVSINQPPPIRLDPLRITLSAPAEQADPTWRPKQFDKTNDPYMENLMTMIETKEAARREDDEMMAFMGEEERLQQESRQRKLKGIVGPKVKAMDPERALFDASRKLSNETSREIEMSSRPKKKRRNPLSGATQTVENAGRGQVWRTKDGRMFAVPYQGPRAGEPIEVGPDFDGEGQSWDELGGFLGTQ